MKKDAVYLIVGAAAYGVLMYIVVSNNMEMRTMGDMRRAAEAKKAKGYLSSRRSKKKAN